MQEHNFNEILDFLCSNIKAKSVKQGVRDELYDHLMCNYETNLAIGMDEENAHNEAINALGDKNKLKLRLSQVHSYNPELSMKKALELLIPACMFSLLFQYLPSGEWYDIIKFLSDILILVAVFCLSKANKKLKLSFVFYGAAFTISALQNAFTVFIENSYPIVFVWVEIFVTILSILSWTYLFLGLSALVKPYLEAYSKKISFGMVITAHILSGLFWIIINLSLIATDKEYLFNSNLIFEDIEVFGVFIIFLLSTAVFAVLVFKRVSECLVGSDHEYKIETSAKRKAVVAVSAVLIAIVPLLATDVYLSTQKAETTPHYIDDTEIAEEEYNRICNNLLSYGVPEKIVYNLPESEIENYSESVPLSEHEALNDKSILFINSYTNEEIKTKIRNNIVAIGLKSGYIRVLSWVEYDKTKGYSDGVFWNYNDYYSIPINQTDEYNGDFLLILSNEKGEIMRNEPIDIYADNGALTDRMTGVRFQAKEGLIVVHAETLSPANIQKTEMLYSVFNSIRVMPFSFTERSPFNFYNSLDRKEFEYKINFFTEDFNFAIPGVEYVNTKEIAE